MPTPREFFESEARDCLDRLAQLLRAPGHEPPDGAELHRVARTLRGSAQLAREDRVFRAAAALEAAARALLHHTLAWTPEVHELALLTLEDLEALAARTEPETGADARLARLLDAWARLGIAVHRPAPTPDGPAPPAPTLDAAPPEFLAFAAREVAGILAELEAALPVLGREPRNREPLKAVLRRQRSLLGAAQLDRLPPVAETLRAIEEVARILGRADAPVTGDALELLRAARDVLGATQGRLQRGEEPAPPAGPLHRLRTLRDRIAAELGEEDAGRAPPAAAEELPVEVVNFFRTETAALLDRIDRMAADALAATPERRAALGREIHDALLALRDIATTFGFPRTAELAAAALATAERELDLLGPLLVQLRERAAREAPSELPPPAEPTAPPPPTTTEPLAPTAATPTAPAAIATPAPAVATPPAAAVVAPMAPTPAPAPAHAAPVSDDDVVPIESLCYRGEAALRRALELRPFLEPAVAGDPAAREALEELFDLLRLGLE